MNKQESKAFIEEVYQLCKNSNEWRELAYELSGSYVEAGWNVTKDDSYSDGLGEAIAKLGFDLVSVDGYGGEGRGDDYWGVFSLSKNGETVYVMLSGSYVSYDGADLDNMHWTIVEPYEKTVRDWKNVR